MPACSSISRTLKQRVCVSYYKAPVREKKCVKERKNRRVGEGGGFGVVTGHQAEVVDISIYGSLSHIIPGGSLL